jgi:hypothetical protein
VRRAEGEVRAGPAAAEEWDGSDFSHLLEEARAFRRVGARALPDPGGFLREVAGGLFGARADDPGGRFALAPWVPEGWNSMALRRLRLHRTLVDVDVRPRAEWATVRLSVSFGPTIPLALSLRNTPPVARVTVDEVPLVRDQAIFTLSAEHELVFFYGAVE